MAGFRAFLRQARAHSLAPGQLKDPNRQLTESPNLSNPASHCDIAWAGDIASEANAKRFSVGAMVV